MSQDLYEDAESVNSDEFNAQPQVVVAQPQPVPIQAPELPYKESHPLFTSFKEQYKTGMELKMKNRSNPNMKLVSLTENRILEATKPAGDKNTVPMCCIDEKTGLAEYIRNFCNVLGPRAREYIQNNILTPIARFGASITELASSINTYLAYIRAQKEGQIITFGRIKARLDISNERAQTAFATEYNRVKAEILDPVINLFAGSISINEQCKVLYDRIISVQGGENFSLMKYINEKANAIDSLNPNTLSEYAMGLIQSAEANEFTQQVSTLSTTLGQVKSRLDDLRTQLPN